VMSSLAPMPMSARSARPTAMSSQRWSGVMASVPPHGSTVLKPLRRRRMRR
jgi:hypothetical protein